MENGGVSCGSSAIGSAASLAVSICGSVARLGWSAPIYQSSGKRQQKIVIRFNFMDEMEMPARSEPIIAENNLWTQKNGMTLGCAALSGGLSLLTRLAGLPERESKK